LLRVVVDRFGVVGGLWIVFRKKVANVVERGKASYRHEFGRRRGFGSGCLPTSFPSAADTHAVTDQVLGDAVGRPRRWGDPTEATPGSRLEAELLSGRSDWPELRLAIERRE
jgi:hypothetical protein